MKKLTNKEKEIMTLYWQHGPMFVRELQEHYDEPRPHFNTLSTIVRIWSVRAIWAISSLAIPISTIRWCRRRSMVARLLRVSSRTTSTTPISVLSPRLSKKKRSA